jgi:hypothetical protein
MRRLARHVCLAAALLALHAGVVGAAVVSGRLAPPTGTLPALTLYAWSVTGAKLYSVTTAEGQAIFSIELPPGRYVVFAAPADPGAPAVYGAYTEFAACTRDKPRGVCLAHGLAPVVVGRHRLEHVDLSDWYLDTAVTAELDRILGRADEPELSDSALSAPRFSEYPAPAWNGTRAAALAEGADERLARDHEALLAAFASRENFSGRAVLVRLGCGDGCESVAIVDLPSGRVAYPAALATLPPRAPCAATGPLEFRRDSRLLTLTAREGAQLVTHYFTWDPEAGALRAIASLARLSASCQDLH